MIGETDLFNKAVLDSYMCMLIDFCLHLLGFCTLKILYLSSA